MHISDGILQPSLLAASTILSAGGVTIGLKRLKNQEIPKVALFTAAFFVASLVHVPVGFSSAHLLLNGLLGIVLGWSAFPAILVGLILQAVLFQFGGLTTLGINTLNMALPAVISGAVYRLLAPRLNTPGKVMLASLLGGFSILASGLMVAAALSLAGDAFLNASRLILAAHLPVAIVEGVISGAVAAFLLKVKPEAIEPPKPTAIVVLLLCASIFTGLSSAAHAHKVNIFAWFDGEKIVGEAYYSKGRNVKASTVKLYNHKGELLATTKTSSNGGFQFTSPGEGRYRLEVEAGQGHIAVTSLEIGSDPSSKGGGSPSVSSKTVTRDEERNCTCLDEGDVDRLLQKRLEPIYLQIKRLSEAQESVTLHDVLSGIGYILGLMGVALYYKSKEKS